MSADIYTAGRPVLEHQYEKDMGRINETLDKLIDYMQLSMQREAREDGAAETQAALAKKALQIKITVLGSILMLVGSFILNILQLATT